MNELELYVEIGPDQRLPHHLRHRRQAPVRRRLVAARAHHRLRALVHAHRLRLPEGDRGRQVAAARLRGRAARTSACSTPSSDRRPRGNGCRSKGEHDEVLNDGESSACWRWRWFSATTAAPVSRRRPVPPERAGPGTKPERPEPERRYRRRRDDGDGGDRRHAPGGRRGRRPAGGNAPVLAGSTDTGGTTGAAGTTADDGAAARRALPAAAAAWWRVAAERPSRARPAPAERRAPAGRRRRA